MPKKKKTSQSTKSKSVRRESNLKTVKEDQPKIGSEKARLPIPAIAAGLVLLGAIGLIIALQQSDEPVAPSPVDGTELQVIEGTGRDPRAQSAGAAVLQSAARVKDLIQGKEGESVQKGSGIESGTNVDELLKDHEIQ